MSSPSELSFEEILKFMLEHNGKVTNHELVKHFKKFLTDPQTRDEARNIFKKHVNSLASIKNQNNEKWLILKRKYMVTNNDESLDVSTDNKPQEVSAVNASVTSIRSAENYDVIQEPVHDQNHGTANNGSDQTEKMETEVVSPNNLIFDTDSKENINTLAMSEEPRPKLHPRRKSSAVDRDASERSSMSDTSKGPRHSTSYQDNLQNIKTNIPSHSESSTSLSETEQKISVKERKQMFNKMASEGDVLKLNSLGNRKSVHGVDEEDRASVVSLDPKGHEWIVRAARGDYHALAKMCSENPKYAKLKDPATGYTAMHWACKRGDENLVKLIAGLARSTVNERSNGGYTPLHIAMQFRHENVYKLLVDVYDADPNVRDWSGRKPRQYLVNLDTSLSPDAYRKFKIKADKKNADKDLGFLRIGSLNVRVKKTTEAFSNFLGVGAARTSSYGPKHARDGMPALPALNALPTLPRIHDGDHLHKSWGSADNIQKDGKSMPPPQYGKVKRRHVGTRRAGDAHSRSTPTTPNQPRAHPGAGEAGAAPAPGNDSDSDSAAGFHAAWRLQRASNCT